MAEDRQALRRRRRRSRRRRIAALGTSVVVVGAGSAVAIAAATDTGTARQVATVGRASITQVVESSGSITSSAKVTPSFSVSGTVRSVAVRVGDSVRAGEVLARLDTTSLQSKVDSAEQSLAQARQQLAADKSGQTSGTGAGDTGSSGTGTTATGTGTTLGTSGASYTALVTTTTTGSAPGGGTPGGGGGTGSTTLSALITQIQAAQHAVIAAQQAVDAGQSAVDAAEKTVAADVHQNSQLRDAQKQACATDATTAACATARADYEAYADTLTVDSATLDGKISAQDAAVHQLDSTITVLDTLLAKLPAAAASGSGGSGSTGGSGGAGSGTGSGTGGRGGSTGSTGGGTLPSGTPGGSSGTGTGTGTGTTTPGTGQSNTTSQPASAAQLAADQASIDAATAEVRAAKQDLGAATLRSPISGKVAAVGYTSGSASSGGSVTVVGTGVQKVSTTVSLAQLPLVKKGQSVSVAADGVSTHLHGRVASIGLLSSSSGSSVSFPVTIQLDSTSPKLYDGVGADVTITTGTARNAVAVPNSAIHSGFGNTHTVTVVKGGTTSTVRVTLGIAGADLTQVTSGLSVGDQVVLADLSKKLPASTESSTGNTGFGGFGGAGGFPNLRNLGGR